MADYVIKSDHESEEWTSIAVENSSLSELSDMASDLATDAVALGSHAKNSEPYQTDDGRGDLDELLWGNNLRVQSLDEEIPFGLPIRGKASRD